MFLFLSLFSTPNVLFTSGPVFGSKVLYNVLGICSQGRCLNKILRDMAHMEPSDVSPTTPIGTQEGNRGVGIYSGHPEDTEEAPGANSSYMTSPEKWVKGVI